MKQHGYWNSPCIARNTMLHFKEGVVLWLHCFSLFSKLYKTLCQPQDAKAKKNDAVSSRKVLLHVF
jgi:hypothetical protein